MQQTGCWICPANRISDIMMLGPNNHTCLIGKSLHKRPEPLLSVPLLGSLVPQRAIGRCHNGKSHDVISARDQLQAQHMDRMWKDGPCSWPQYCHEDPRGYIISPERRFFGLLSSYSLDSQHAYLQQVVHSLQAYQAPPRSRKQPRYLTRCIVTAQIPSATLPWRAQTTVPASCFSLELSSLHKFA